MTRGIHTKHNARVLRRSSIEGRFIELRIGAPLVMRMGHAAASGPILRCLRCGAATNYVKHNRCEKCAGALKGKFRRK